VGPGVVVGVAVGADVGVGEGVSVGTVVPVGLGVGVCTLVGVGETERLNVKSSQLVRVGSSTQASGSLSGAVGATGCVPNL
jgi:hypothetical protein